MRPVLFFIFPLGLFCFIGCAVCFDLSCSPGMFVCLSCVICPSDCFSPSDVSYTLNYHATCDVFSFYPVCPVFSFVLSIRNAFYYPISYMIYIVMITCDVFLHAVGSMIYFILCSRDAFRYRCVICCICSLPSVLCSFMLGSYVL